MAATERLTPPQTDNTFFKDKLFPQIIPLSDALTGNELPFPKVSPELLVAGADALINTALALEKQETPLNALILPLAYTPEGEMTILGCHGSLGHTDSLKTILKRLKGFQAELLEADCNSPTLTNRLHNLAVALGHNNEIEFSLSTLSISAAPSLENPTEERQSDTHPRKKRLLLPKVFRSLMVAAALNFAAGPVINAVVEANKPSSSPLTPESQAGLQTLETLLINSAHAQGVVHVVQTGETLYSIADRYGLSAQQIADLNGIANMHYIQAGQYLTIPGDQPPSEPTPIPLPAYRGDGGQSKTTQTAYITNECPWNYDLGRPAGTLVNAVKELDGWRGPNGEWYPDKCLSFDRSPSPQPAPQATPTPRPTTPSKAQIENGIIKGTIPIVETFEDVQAYFEGFGVRATAERLTKIGAGAGASYVCYALLANPEISWTPPGAVTTLVVCTIVVGTGAEQASYVVTGWPDPGAWFHERANDITRWWDSLFN